MPAGVFKDDRARRRDQTCIGTGLVFGAALGVFAGIFGGSSVFLSAAMGAAAGGIAGRLVAPYLSVDEWDPPVDRRPNVGANSPDDDIATV
jgi:hypothetical protein